MSRRIAQLRALVGRHPRWTLVGAITAAVAAIGIAVAVGTWSNGDREPAAPGPRFAVSPRGSEVGRLAPIQVSFERAPSTRDGTEVLDIDPKPAGEYVWLTDRILLYQPDYPGMDRGREYRVKVRARPEAGLNQDWTGTFTVGGKLSVDTVLPADGDTEVPKNAQVLVQFSRGVAPLTTVAAIPTEQILEFTPALEGKGEWVNTSLYRFVPAAIPPNTTFRARVKAGLTAASDGVLEQDYAWSFSTFTPAVTSFEPSPSTEFVSIRQSIVVRFNQPMDRASVQSLLSLAAAGGPAVAGTYAWSDGDATVTFRPAANLARATSYTAKLPAGAKGASGGTTSIEYTTSFQTVAAPAVARTEPANGGVAQGWYGANVEFVTPMDPESFEGKVSISGVDPDNVTVNQFDRQLYIGAALAPSTRYTVTLAAGLRDRYGDAMGPYTFSFTTPARPASLTYAVPGFYGTYSASTEPKLFFHAVNRETASFTLWRLTSSEAAARRLAPPEYRTSAAPWTPASEPIRTWTETASGNPNEVVIGSTSLSGGGPLTKGDYFLRTAAGYGAEFAFSVVDTALITKVGFDEVLVWALDLDSGRPVSGVDVSASGLGFTSPASAKTDADGLVRFPITSVYLRQTPSDYRSPWVVVVEGTRKGVNASHWAAGGGFGFYRGDGGLNIPVDYVTYHRRYVGWTYPDRPIYRPGEEVFYRGVLREDDDAAYRIPGSDAQFTIAVSDQQGTVLTSSEAKLTEFGTFSGSLVLPREAATGQYFVQVNWTNAPFENRTVSVAANGFLVAEFRKPEFEVALATALPAVAVGDPIAVDVSARFFFGGAVAGATANWSATASPSGAGFPGFTDYAFSDFDRYRTFREGNPSRGTGATALDGEGKARLSIPTTPSQDGASQTYTVGVTVLDLNGQAVAGSTTVQVHPASTLVGVRIPSYVAEIGKPTRADVVTVGLDGTVLPNAPVTVKLYDRKWVTTKKKTSEGGYLYESEPVDTLLTSLSTRTGADGKGSVAFTPEKAGSLRVVAEVTDSRGRIARGATYAWLWGGSGFVPWRVSNDDYFELVADKARYEVGDTARVLVPAPFDGAIGLVTVERGKVKSTAIRQFPTTTETLEIPVGDAAVPNVFVGTVLYRPPTNEDPLPRYKVGYVNLPVSTRVRELTVSVAPDRARAKPGDKVTYTLKVTDWQGKGVRAEVSAAVVDKALLSLADETGPTGLRAFWFERGLGVTTSSSLSVSVDRANDVIQEPQQGGKGGGGLDDPRLRQDFRNLAYWKADLVTNAEGLATFEVAMPDNLTTWHVLARAVTANGPQVGEARSELLSTQPLLLRPSLPRFLRVGDAAALRLLVTNGTSTATTVNVTIEAEGVDLADAGPKTADLKGDGTALLQWPVKVVSPGTAKVTFKATSSIGTGDAVVQEFPLAFDLTPEVTATGGVVRDDAMVEAVFLPRFAVLTNGNLELAVQPSLTGNLRGALAAFPVYDNEGTEYVASRLTATAAVSRAAASSGGSGAAFESDLQRDIARLLTRRRAGGGFAWCSHPNCLADEQATAVALIALGQAKRSGASVDPGAVSEAQSFLARYLDSTSDVASPRDVNRKAYLLYALAISGQTRAGEARAWYEQRKAELSYSGLAYILTVLSEAGGDTKDPMVGQILNDITSGVTPSANGNLWQEDAGKSYWGSRTELATGLVVEALVRARPDHPLIEESVRWLMAVNVDRYGWAMGNAQVISGLADFAVETGELAGNFPYAVRVGSETVLSGSFEAARDSDRKTATVKLDKLGAPSTTLVAFIREAASRGRLYYTMNLRYLTPAKDIESLNRGIAVAHEYTALDRDGVRIDRAKVGDVVRVKVTVVAPVDRHNVTVDDFLPGGFEPIDPRLKITDPNLVAQLEADRRKAAAEQGGGKGGYMAPWYRWYYSPWTQVDLRDDRVTLRATFLPKGVHEYVYYTRASNPGDYFVAPAFAQESFFPDVFGRSDSGRFVIGQ